MKHFLLAPALIRGELHFAPWYRWFHPANGRSWLKPEIPKQPFPLPTALFFALLLPLLLNSGVLAQSTFRGGLIVGGNTSQVDGDGAYGFYKAGLALGLFGQFKPVERLAVNMELLYDQLGSNNRGMPLLVSNYASVPVTVGAIVPVHFGTDEHQVMFLAGLSPGYLLKAENTVFRLDYRQYLHKVDLRGLIGVEYKMGKSVAFNIRYGRSVLPFANTTSAQNLIYYTEQLGPWHRYYHASLRVYFGQ